MPDGSSLGASSVSTEGRASPAPVRQGHALTWFPQVNVARDGWSDAARAALRTLWAEGWSGSIIAAALRTTKNAVVGASHRLHLPSRPSPIPTVKPRPKMALRGPAVAQHHSGGGASSSRVTPIARGVLPAVPGPAPDDLGAGVAAAGSIPGGQAAAMGPSGEATIAAAPPAVRAVFRLPAGVVHRRCQWPIWPHTATRSHADYGRMCEAAPVVPGRSYCAEHCARAAVRRGEAA